MACKHNSYFFVLYHQVPFPYTHTIRTSTHNTMEKFFDLVVIIGLLQEDLHMEKLSTLKGSLLSSRVPQVRFCPCKGRKSRTLAVRVKLSKEKYPLTSTIEVTPTVALKRSGLVVILNGVLSSSSNLASSFSLVYHTNILSVVFLLHVRVM